MQVPNEQPLVAEGVATVISEQFPGWTDTWAHSILVKLSSYDSFLKVIAENVHSAGLK